MSQWQIGDGFRAASQSRELLQSWSNQEEEKTTGQASAECWSPSARASSFHFDATQLGHVSKVHTPAEAPLAARVEQLETPKIEQSLATRVELHSEHAEGLLRRPDAPEHSFAGQDKQSTPLSRIYDILDVHSASSRWLEQRGYLEAFKSPNCTLDLNFGTDASGSRVGAVMTAPDGTKRTVIACEGGNSYQRLTAANGQELVKFLSSGQIVELNHKRA
ncbi:MAG: hypothetical protein K2X27_15185 [Candidatus Obscuribacterales bacterium]|nr:hypothetical protein [Candidatus Obscuribacterales bacterium]